MVSRDLIYKAVLVNSEPIAEPDYYVAPQVFPCLQKQAVRSLRRMSGQQMRQCLVNLVNAFLCKYLIYGTKPTLLDREQLSVFVSKVHDIVDESHQQIKFRPCPEVVGFTRGGGVCYYGICDGLHKLWLCIQPIQAVPAVGVLHVEKVYGLYVVPLFFVV